MSRQPDENELKQIRELLQTGRKDEATRLYRAITRAGIFETKDAIAELERQLPSQTQAKADQSGFLLDDDQPPFMAQDNNRVFDELADIRLLAKQGDKIQAIKLYRERKGVSLEEAKRAVEAMSDGTFTASGNAPAAPQPATAQPVNAGQIDQCIMRGEKIMAVKMYRQLHGVDLKTAKDAVDAREMALRGSVSEPYQPAETSQPMSQADPIDQCIMRGEKIMAIKLYRERYQVGLKEAKDAVDARENVLRASAPESFQQPPLGGQSSSGPGAGFIFLMVLLLLGLIYWYFSV